MTIALGIVASDGAVLCADSQYTSGIKVEGQKIFPWWRKHAAVVFAFSGHVSNATVLIQQCEKSLNKIKNRPTADSIERILRREIKSFQEDYIDKRPYDERDEAQVDLIIAIATAADGMRLFYTEKPVLVGFTKYRAVGSGGCDLGQYVMRRAYRPEMTTHDAIVMAMQALAAAKQHDPYCGGPSQFVTIKSGVVSGIVPFDVDKTEPDILKYERWAANLLLDIGDFSMDQQEFLNRIERFATNIQGMREVWEKNGLPFKDLLNSLTTQASMQSTSQKSKQTQ